MVPLLKRFFNLHQGMDDRQKVMDSVVKNATFKGANLWILACAIIIASVGLNVNSTAVIIGAMLISPLMGPIVASGFALGIYDFELLKKSAKYLLVATILSLIVSTIYFLISPFKDAQSELLARTSPNIYDILIALFGGLVGAISITRIEKGNPLPGVAIATALMPPLCTAGYGLATGHISFFLGALFLYSINAVFICFATFIVVKIMKFPLKDMIDKKREKLVRLVMVLVAFLILVPAVYFAVNLYKKQRFEHIIDNFVQQEFTSKGYITVYKKIVYNQNPKNVEIALLRKRFSKEEIDSLNIKINKLAIPETRLVFRQDTVDRIEQMSRTILDEINDLETAVREKDSTIDGLRQLVNKKDYDLHKLLGEVRVFFPAIQAISFSEHPALSADSTPVNLIIYQSKRELSTAETNRLTQFLNFRLNVNNLELLYKKP